MTGTTTKCPRCGAEIPVIGPGQRIPTAFVRIAYSNGEAVEKLERAIELVDVIASEFSFRDDLGIAATLLREVSTELVTIKDA